MILNLADTSLQDRYVPDVIGYNFSVLMPDPYSRTTVRKSPSARPGGIGRLARIGRMCADYCRSNPPDAATVALLAARGTPVNLIDCGYSTGGPGETGFTTATPAQVLAENPNLLPAVAPPAPYVPAPVPNCDPMDIACVAQATAIQTQNEINFAKQQADYNRAVCLVGGTDPAVCAARWPAGFTGDVPATNLTPEQVALATNPTVTAYDFTPLTPGGPVPAQLGPTGAPPHQVAAGTNRPNQSVPPTSQLTTIPTLPAGVSTQQMLLSAYGPGVPAGGAAPSSQLIPGIDNTKLLLGAGLLVAVLMVVKK